MTDNMRRLPFVLVLMAALPAAAAAQRPDPPDFQRRGCPAPLADLGATCGEYRVPEDREKAGGRTIGLNVVIIPATGPGIATEAVTFLAGGPGEAATGMAPMALRLHGALREERDFLFVDQRGTGGSNPLECRLYDPEDPRTWLGDFFPPAAIRDCRAELEAVADLRLYTTAIAADDLDDVRAAFGYETLTLMGISYGTRAALVYMRRHPDQVRAAVLEGVVPPGEFIPLTFARDAQRALDGVLASCEPDPACAAAFPEVREDALQAFAGLEAGPVPVAVVDPVRGGVIDVALSSDLAAEAVRYMLYSAGTAAYLPVVLHQAAAGDYSALAEFALFGRRNIVASGANGMYLSVTCAEDLPWIPEGEGERAADGTFLGDYRLRQQRTACRYWPRGPVPADFAEPVRAPAPTLIISGEWDPVTPPRMGDVVYGSLPNARHVVVPDGGHGTGGLLNAECVHGMVTTFAASASLEAIDAACLVGVRRVPFATSNPAPPPARLPATELAALAGEYHGIDAPLTAAVAVEGEVLRLDLPGGPRFLLAPVSADRFRIVGAFGLDIRFERGDAVTMTLVEGGIPQVTLRRH
jgi:pimeloyl-ACP methyl ester carboxylesterase